MNKTMPVNAAGNEGQLVGIRTVTGKPSPLGVEIHENNIHFAFVSTKEDCGVLLYDKASGKETDKIAFPKEARLGNIHYMALEGIKPDEQLYSFYENGAACTDIYARSYADTAAYGHKNAQPFKKSRFVTASFAWEGDSRPCIPYEKSICYCMHVRGFTKHASSEVKARGTFAGIVEKLSYLKELGITTLELQPAYEYEELQSSGKAEEDTRFQNPADSPEHTDHKLNYWGYTEGYYYSPKKAFAFSKDEVAEYKELVRALHLSGMEVVMQFYFTGGMQEMEISNILRFWVQEYHVDGFHLKGDKVPISQIRQDPALASTKIWYYDFAEQTRGPEENGNPYRNLAGYRDDYMQDMRRFLKGDEGMLQAVMYHMRNNPCHMGRINYFSNYEGFTMMDMVSYERKHNEDNGEDNKDGRDANYSWNCGVEGRSRRKAIGALRYKQIKNALCLLFLSQGTPLLFMGDEFGNTQNGNNNPYCQDNEISWLNWKELVRNEEIYAFTRQLIALRKAHPILRNPKEFRVMDSISCGYPDVSYHGEAPWRPCLDNYSRQLGMMYCGKYAETGSDGKEDAFFYIAMNMHWESHAFALPRLPKGIVWALAVKTDSGGTETYSCGEQGKIQVPSRCICVFIGKGAEGAKK